jgi:hypothetical protein
MFGHNCRAYLIVCVIICVIVSFADVTAEPTQALDPLQKEIDAPVPQPESRGLFLIYSVPVTNGEAIIGRIAVYDDRTTARFPDVAALYDAADDLVALGWFDRFGIQRIAIDNGIVKQTGKLEGQFVFVLEGEPL